MSKIKYGVWFHGNDQESEGICWEHRKPFIADTKEQAEIFLKFMQDNNYQGDVYSTCMIIVDDLE